MVRNAPAAALTVLMGAASCAPAEPEVDWASDTPGDFLHSGFFAAPAPARIEFGDCNGLTDSLPRLRTEVARRADRPTPGALSCARLPDHAAQVFSSLWIVREGGVADCSSTYCTTWFVTVTDGIPDAHAPVMSRGPFVAAATPHQRAAACKTGVAGACAPLRPVAEAAGWQTEKRPGWVSDNDWNYVVDLEGRGPTATALGLRLTAIEPLPHRN